MSADGHAAALSALRRELHQIPEVGLSLPKTQARVLRALEGLGLEITTGHALSSVVGVLRGRARHEGRRRVVLLRADMDALPVLEETGLEWASTNGAMHACGHDLHMAMLVGAASTLAERADELAGDVVLMFQPGEEGRHGAEIMIGEGVLEAAGALPDAAYALHVWAAGDEPCGTFTTTDGVTMAAADVVRVTVKGRGGHGSAPHLALDPVPALAAMITATHTMVTRRFDVFDPVVVTVGQAHAGGIANVIPDDGWFEATLRTFSTGARDRLFAAIRQTMAGVAAAHGVEAEVSFHEQYPVTVNDPAHADLVADLATELFGAGAHSRWRDPLAAAEDFSFVLRRVPGCFIGLAACPPEIDSTTAPFNHSPRARFDDSVLPRGARMLSELAARALRPA